MRCHSSHMGLRVPGSSSHANCVARHRISIQLPVFKKLVIVTLRFRATECSPVFHHPYTLFEKVTAPICSLNLVSNRMCQRHFGNVAGVGCAFRAPVAKC